jgi:hypothetical protein
MARCGGRPGGREVRARGASARREARARSTVTVSERYSCEQRRGRRASERKLWRCQRASHEWHMALRSNSYKKRHYYKDAYHANEVRIRALAVHGDLREALKEVPPSFIREPFRAQTSY